MMPPVGMPAAFEEIAAILARGVARLHCRDQNLQDSGVSGLDQCSTSRPCGVDAQESVREDIT